MLQIDASCFSTFGRSIVEAMPRLRAVMREMERTTLELFADEAEIYPGEPAGHKYKRTDALKRGWQLAKADMYAESSGDEENLTLTNRVAYAGIVQGNAQKDIYREIGWKTEDEMFDPIWEQAVEDLGTAVEKVLEEI